MSHLVGPFWKFGRCPGPAYSADRATQKEANKHIAEAVSLSSEGKEADSEEESPERAGSEAEEESSPVGALDSSNGFEFRGESL